VTNIFQKQRELFYITSQVHIFFDDSFNVSLVLARMTNLKKTSLLTKFITIKLICANNNKNNGGNHMSKIEALFNYKNGYLGTRYMKGYEKFVRKSKTHLIFSFYCETWLKTNKSKLKESTYVKYNNILERHIKPCLGEYQPKHITTHVINSFRDELLYEKELAPKTVKDILIVLRAIFKFVTQNSDENLQNVEIIYPKNVKKEMKVLSTKEQECFVSYLIENMDNCKFGILLALYTGIRIGELCALRWNCISLENKTIKINETMQRLQALDGAEKSKTKIVTGTPKSDSSMRVIPLNDSLLELCKRMEPAEKDCYLLTGTGDYMEPRVLQYRMKKYTTECGLEGVHFHVLRHTFATRCVEVGCEVKSLSEILGHSTTTITLDRYVHSSMELKRNYVNKLAPVLQ